jgi:hypothetical protein
MRHTIVKVTQAGDVSVISLENKRSLTHYINDNGMKPSKHVAAAGQCINEDVEGNRYLIFPGGPLALRARYGIVGKQQKLFDREGGDEKI